MNLYRDEAAVLSRVSSAERHKRSPAQGFREVCTELPKVGKLCLAWADPPFLLYLFCFASLRFVGVGVGVINASPWSPISLRTPRKSRSAVGCIGGVLAPVYILDHGW